MRLICPNCGAQYEVSDDVIPAQGRDVQCSNCGHTWFESPGASVAAEEELIAAEDADETNAAPPAPEPDQESGVSAEQEPEPEQDPKPNNATEEDDLSPAPQHAPVKRQPLDDSIAAILQEEAAREEASRAAEAQSGLESQGDLGIDEMPTMTEAKKAESAERIARLKGEEPETDVSAAVAATVAGSRRELLPDIDDINATLRSDSERDAPPPLPEEEEAQERRGFRFGFFSVLILIGILVAIYAFADQISAAVPALESALNAYVAMVDRLRIWFDVQMQTLLTMLEGTEPEA